MSQANIDQALGLFRELSEIDPESLARRESLGSLNFEQILPDLFAIQRMGATSLKLHWDRLPERWFTNIVNPLVGLVGAIRDLQAFTLNDMNPMGRRDQLIGEIRTKYSDTYEALARWSSLLLDSVSAEEVRIELEHEGAELTDQLKGFVEIARKRSQEIEEVSEAARAAVGKTGLSKYSVIFSEAGVRYDRVANWWLWGAFACGIGTLVGIVVLLAVVPPKAGPIDAVSLQHITAKLVIISILYYATFFCAKNYRVNRHLSVMNEHRQNALTTFEAFVQGTDDPATKNAVLLEATRSIFHPGMTGYLQGNDDATPFERVIEVVKSGVSHGGGSR